MIETKKPDRHYLSLLRKSKNPPSARNSGIFSDSGAGQKNDGGPEKHGSLLKSAVKPGTMEGLKSGKATSGKKLLSKMVKGR